MGMAADIVLICFLLAAGRILNLGCVTLHNGRCSVFTMLAAPLAVAGLALLLSEDTTVGKLRVTKETSEAIEMLQADMAYKQFCADTTVEKQRAIKETSEMIKTPQAESRGL